MTSRRPRRPGPADRFRAWSNSRPVATTFLAVTALVLVVVTWTRWSDATALDERGVDAPAVVVDVVPGSRSGDTVTVRYTTGDGRLVLADVGEHEWAQRPRVGDEVTVRYDPQDPEGNVTDAAGGPDGGLTVVLGVCAVAAAVLAVLTARGRVDWARVGEWMGR